MSTDDGLDDDVSHDDYPCPLDAEDYKHFDDNMDMAVQNHPFIVDTLVKFYVFERQDSVDKILLHEGTDDDTVTDLDYEGVDIQVRLDDGTVHNWANRTRTRIQRHDHGNYLTELSLRAMEEDEYTPDGDWVSGGGYYSETLKTAEAENKADFIILSRFNQDKGLPYEHYVVNVDKLQEQFSDGLSPTSPTYEDPVPSDGGRWAFYFNMQDIDDSIDYFRSFTHQSHEYKFSGKLDDGLLERLEKDIVNISDVDDALNLYLDQDDVLYINSDGMVASDNDQIKQSVVTVLTPQDNNKTL